MILAITSIGTFMGTLNSTIVNVALPVMAQEMEVSISAIQWVISAYLLTTVLLLPIFGKLSEFTGKKYIFASGTLIFVVGSALCAISHTLGLLVVSRILQAIGTSGMFSMAQDMLMHRRQTEVTCLTGAISDYGKKTGVPTPTCDVLTQVVEAQQDTYALQYVKQ